MNPSTWMNTQIPGYRALTIQEKRAIRDFAMLWSFFEDRWFANSCSVPAIVTEAQARVTANTSMAPFQPAIAHFQARYFAGGHVTPAFQGLRLRPNDRRQLVEEVLSGATDEPGNVLSALLIVVYRLRNNFFHGEKWDYGFQGQLGNFRHANDVMISAMRF